MAKKKQEKEPKTHDDLRGFDIRIDEFGTISSGTPVDKLNEFLDKNVDDKKLREKKNKEEE